MGRGGKRRGSYGNTGPRPQPQQQAMPDGPIMPMIRGRDIDLGDLSGESREPVLATFTYFGKRFRVNPDLNEIMVMDLLEDSGALDADDPQQLAVVKGWAREHLHDDDFDEFWSLARHNGQGLTDIIRLCNRVLEMVVERPTSPPTDSSAGRPDIKPSSPAGASAPAIAKFRETAQVFVERFEAQGRPDKAVQVMLAMQAHEASVPAMA